MVNNKDSVSDGSKKVHDSSYSDNDQSPKEPIDSGEGGWYLAILENPLVDGFRSNPQIEGSHNTWSPVLSYVKGHYFLYLCCFFFLREISPKLYELCM